MKPIHIIAGLGATAIIGIVAWMMYLNSAPLSGQNIRRGLNPELLQSAKPPVKSAPKAPAAKP